MFLKPRSFNKHFKSITNKKRTNSNYINYTRNFQKKGSTQVSNNIFPLKTTSHFYYYKKIKIFQGVTLNRYIE